MAIYFESTEIVLVLQIPDRYWSRLSGVTGYMEHWLALGLKSGPRVMGKNFVFHSSRVMFRSSGVMKSGGVHQ